MRKGVPPEVFEWAFTLAAIAFLVWQSEAFREPEFVRGAGDRYRKAVELKAPIEPQAAGTDRVTDLCSRYGGWLPKSERDSTATRTGVCAQDSRHAIPLTAMGPIRPNTLADLTKARDAMDRSLAQPVKAKLARLDELENRAREARAETDVHGAIDGIAGETSVYREAYGIAAAGARSVPLDCAWTHLEAKYNSPDATEAGAVYALLGMAAILDGDAARASAAASPADGTKADAWSKVEQSACAGLGQPRQVIAQAAEIVATARASANNAGKSLAAQDLLANAHWVYATWAVAGLVLLQIGRLGLSARFFLPLAAFVWAAIGWVTQVHVEWISDRAAQTATLLKYGIEGGKVFQVLAIAAALCPDARRAVPQQGKGQARAADTLLAHWLRGLCAVHGPGLVAAPRSLGLRPLRQSIPRALSADLRLRGFRHAHDALALAPAPGGPRGPLVRRVHDADQTARGGPAALPAVAHLHRRRSGGARWRPA